jgi:hypothetical protein
VVHVEQRSLRILEQDVAAATNLGLDLLAIRQGCL